MKANQIKMAMLIVAGGVTGHFGGEMMSAFADNLASTSTVLNEGVIVPYDGYLMLDSAPVNAAAQNLRFSLYESSTGGTAQWVETQTVSVNGGKFSVALGKGTKVSSTPPNAGFDAVILDAQKLYIGIEVDDGNGTFIELAGRQAIEAAPFAAWAAKSADFEVARDLNVQRNTQINGGLGVVSNANIGGSLSAGSTQINGGLGVTSNASVGGTLGVTSDANVGGSVNATGQVVAREFNGAMTPRYQNWNSQGTGDGGAAIYNDSSATYNALMLVGNNSAGGDRRVRLYDDVLVNSDLSTGGNVTVAGGLSVSGKITGFSLTGLYRANSQGRGGISSDVAMISTNDGFCFLTDVQYNHNGGDPPTQRCEVYTSGTTWRLYAGSLYANADSEARCGARCVRY